ncbi:hypothetical protein PB01_03895 [Psychrobacillus glaciei]|uniref:Lipopolysaccharide biosynthesis protein n=1 Tax=Psychrobacillus glaciei TaxID=2283160 RepID=A0A5J6SPF7_9BACI|nr:oligosaccharide flippase family protein [Psychrobacillus glaciei]QFF98027.1 hypothetical protein PB01_03895 [Psychrobacillus glaciei]
MKLLKSLYSNKIFKSILILLSGTILSQIIVLAASPLLTRLFSPEDIGTLTVFTTLLVFITIIMTFKYELAIVIPKSKREAISVFNLTIIIVIMMTILLTVTLIIGKDFFISVLKLDELKSIYLILPLTAFLLGISNILNFWFVRSESYQTISKSKLIQSTVTSSSQIVGGLLNLGTKSLIFGYLIGQFAVTLFYLRKFNKDIKSSYFFSKKGIKKVAIKYNDLPKYNATQSLVNSFSSNFIIILFSISFSSAVVGYYAMAIRLVQFPIAVITSSVKDVFFKELTKVFNSNIKRYHMYLLKYTLTLIVIAIVPFVIIYLYAPDIFSFALGAEWAVAGEYSKFLSFWLLCAFVNTPAMLTIQLFKMQKYLLIYEIVLLIVRISIIYFASMNLEPIFVIIIYSIIGAMFNLSLIAIVYTYIKKYVKKLDV